MRNIYSNIYKVNKSSLLKAVNYLKNNKIIGVPTETVYGLAGNAYSKKSIDKIYKLKKRPKKNPLIIHYSDLNDLSKDVYLNRSFFKLYNKFCPGPLTFIINKKPNSKISKKATANLTTVAVRFPKNRIIRKLLKKINFPLAIPSANNSGGISPVSPSDVAEEFKNKIKIILNGGQCKIGLESTVVDLVGKLRILRPGKINLNEIRKILKKKIISGKNVKKIISPGLFKKHYSPGIPMFLNQKKSKKDCAFICFGKKFKKTRHSFNLSPEANLEEAAKNLYKTFRIIKNKKYKIIYVSKIPNKGIGIAINDRLKHASSN